MRKHETNMPHCWCNPKKTVFPNGNMHIAHRYGEYLREVRVNKGLFLRSVARELGFSAAFLSDVENDKRNPNEKIINYYSKL